MLAARLATNKAKPNGVYSLIGTDIEHQIQDFPIGDIPGVGWAAKQRFNEQGISTIGGVQKKSVEDLKNMFGDTIGQKFYNFARGIDNRPLENKLQQTVGVEINWAIRFEFEEQVKQFVKEMCDEVLKRMKIASIQSRSLTVTAKKRDYIGEPSKWLGCGHCIDFSKSQNCELITNAHYLFQVVFPLLQSFHIPVKDIRGLGIHLKASKEQILEKGQMRINFKPLEVDQRIVPDLPITPTKRKTKDRDFFSPRKRQHVENSIVKALGIRRSDIDIEVLKELPPEILAELDINPDYAKAPDSPLQYKRSAGNVVNEPSMRNEENGNVMDYKFKEFEEQHLYPTISQVDPDVWKCLPKAIQLEQKKAARIRSREKKKNIAALINKPVDINRPKLASLENPKDILQKIKEWLTLVDYELPHEEDVEIISKFLGELVDDFDLELCCRYLMLINQATIHNSPWQTAFMSILSNVNNLVNDRYGNYLDLRKYSIN
jgi:DNA repair protein REV1